MEKHREGKTAKAIEQQTVKIPSDIFLWSSMACIGFSMALKCMKRNHAALFIDQWVAPFPLLDIYNKIVKTGKQE